MHAIGTRLPATRCLRALTQDRAQQGFANVLAASASLTGQPSVLLGSRRILPTQSRYTSNKPGSGFPEKPGDSENTETQEKGESSVQPSAASSESIPEDVSETSKIQKGQQEQQQVFAPITGRGRSTNHASSASGIPPFIPPDWFFDHHVQICEPNPTTTTFTREYNTLDGIWQHLQRRLLFDPMPTQDNGDNRVPSKHRPGEAIHRELLSTIFAELHAPAPLTRLTKDPKNRPISLLYTHNYKGSRISNDLVGHIGAALGADVIHLDATTLARLSAPYFGSTLYFGRGKQSMLGYTAAQINGRSCPVVTTLDDGNEENFVLRGKSVFSLLQSVDQRVTWDELKLGRVCKEIANAAWTKKKHLNPEAAKSERTIVHVHNYVEMAMTAEGLSLINKLRSTVERMWLDGSKIVIVASAANDANASSVWHAKIKELSVQDCYPIFLSPSQDLSELRSWERSDYLYENLQNVSWMLESLKSKPAFMVVPKDSDQAKELIDALSTRICSNHWIYRLSTQAIGLLGYEDALVDFNTLVEAFEQMRTVDEARRVLLNPTVTPSQPLSSPLESLINLDNDIDLNSKADQQSPPKLRNLDDEEKKLLSGLVNVADIHTTFDDVIATSDVRESLVALTTLSLQHPQAFSYGVLARERIHGALLYGPPGTGKTLMAKAIAKESGANMLEISAASINDMWVGNSEKNVRAVFSLARKMSPMVVFLDEADSLLGSRARQPNRGGYRETINQFLRELDGLTHSINTQKIFLLVSTNAPQDLDEAVLRRLPRRILVDLPLKEGRLAILQSLLRDETLDKSISLEKLATDTELYSGSDLKNLAVAAAMEAAKEELTAKNEHIGSPEEFLFPAKRVLFKRHFDKATKDITASISEDMQSLRALRKFDQRYGDARRRKPKAHMGFEVMPQTVNSNNARVRSE